MKKTTLSLLLCLLLILGCPAGAVALEPETPADPYAEFRAAASTYVNPQDIVICRPADGYSTREEKISIFGACDYSYPLYINGQQISYTEHGFFTHYVSLQKGANTFTLTNGDKTKVINVTRKTSSGGSSGGGSKVVAWDASHKAQYVTVNQHNSTRIAYPGAEELMAPLAMGTVARVTGETGELYRLFDGSFVYKENMLLSDGTLPVNTISAAEIVPEAEYRCTELRLSMSQNALYTLTVGENSALLTVHNTAAAVNPAPADNRIIQYTTLTVDKPGNWASYFIKFHEDAPLNGYYVEFRDGALCLGFKHIQRVKNNSLAGVRIHLDAGHGGSEPGASGPAAKLGPLEKDINLSITLYAKEYLESRGATVLMTREDDSATPLKERAARVAYLKPDLSFSFHCNAVDISANYNNAAGFRAYYTYAEEAGEYMNNAIADSLGIGKTYTRHKNLAMTRMTGYPAVLTETLFMTNPADYEWLIKLENQKAFGEAAAKAMESWLLKTAEADITVKIDGTELKSIHPPLIREGRTLVPLRAIFEALGATVDWDTATRTATAVRTAPEDGSGETLTVVLPIGSNEMKVSRGNAPAEVRTLDVPAQLISGRTYIPARAVSEALGAAVDWDPATQTVTITR